jgi:hypothetical protein
MVSLFKNNYLQDVFHVENYTINLLSISKHSRDLNYEVILKPKSVNFQDLNTKEIIAEGYLENGLYFLSRNKEIFYTQKNEDLNKLWHKRVGHHSDKILKLMFKFSNIDCSNYEICKLVKQTKLLFCNSNSKSNKIFELVHSDVWGSAPVESYNGFKYFIIFINDFSKTTWIYLMKNKSKVFFHF